MKKRKITKKQRKAQRAAARQQRADQRGPAVTVQRVGEDISIEEVAEIFGDGEILISPGLLEHLEWND